jgi:4a-hydroxytetrahydrobiopterin dehydratase
MAQSPLSEEHITANLEGILWRRDGDAIERELELEDFQTAIATVVRIAALAEAANHHPDILVHGWNKLRITLSTHDAGGLTDADFELAGQIDELVQPHDG